MWFTQGETDRRKHASGPGARVGEGNMANIRKNDLLSAYGKTSCIVRRKLVTWSARSCRPTDLGRVNYVLNRLRGRGGRAGGTGR